MSIEEGADPVTINLRWDVDYVIFFSSSFANDNSTGSLAVKSRVTLADLELNPLIVISFTIS